MSLQSAQRAFDNGIATLIAKDGERVVGFADFGRYWVDDLQDAGEVYAIYIMSGRFAFTSAVGLSSMVRKKRLSLG